MKTPALVVAATWSFGVALAVVAAPGVNAIGALAFAGAALLAVLVLVVRPVAIVLAGCAMLLGVARAELAAPDPAVAAAAARQLGAIVIAVGEVDDDPRVTATGVQFTLAPDSIRRANTALPAVGSLLVRTRGVGKVFRGDRVKVYGRLAAPTEVPGFDRRGYLALKHVYLQLAAQRLELVSPGSEIRRLPERLRDAYRQRLDELLPPPHAAVLLGIVLGIRGEIPTRLQQDLIATGLVHLLVLSGLKVAVFARLVAAFCRPLLGRAAPWAAVPLVIAYAVTGGATPAAVRAASMGALVLVAERLGRSTHVWTSLALVAAAMLGWSPELALDTGFQLSFVGTGAIVLLTPPLERVIHFVPGWVREPFAVTCAAQVGTVPLMASDFHLLSPVAPLANAAVLPALPFLVCAGLLLPIVAAVPPLAQAAVIAIAGVLQYVEQVATVLAPLPGAALQLPPFSHSAAVAYYALLGAAVAGWKLPGRARLPAVAAGLLCPLLVGAGEVVNWMRPPATATVIDVGDGQAVLLTGPGGRILIDTGPSPSKLHDAIGARSTPWSRGVEALLLTAPGAAHTGGLDAVGGPSRLLLLPGSHLAGAALGRATAAAVSRGARIDAVRARSRIDIDGFRLDVLAPQPSDPADEPGTGYVAVRAVAAASGRSFCDFSDLDRQAQIDAAARLTGGCDYLLLPAGGRTAPAPELLRRAAPRRVIASVGPGRLARELSNLNVERTNELGSIELPM